MHATNTLLYRKCTEQSSCALPVVGANSAAHFMRSRISFLLSLLKQGETPSQIFVKLAVRSALAGCETVLDVGCGTSSLIRQIGFKYTAGIEGYKPAFEKAVQLKTHDKLVFGDVRNLLSYFQPREFDACVALDVIEHLPKPDGLELISAMERIARRRVVIFTPNGFLPQTRVASDDLEEHLSGWEPMEMKQMGYKVTGMLGPKGLRTERYALTRRPAALWSMFGLVSDIFWTRSRPEKAAAILCVKSLNAY